MTVYVYRNGHVVPKGSVPSIGSGPMIISDDLGSDLEHHGFADGRRTASKSEFRRWTKQAGCDEIGNDRRERRGPAERPEAVKADVGQAINMLRNGYRPNNVSGEGSGEGWI